MSTIRAQNLINRLRVGDSKLLDAVTELAATMREIKELGGPALFPTTEFADGQENPPVGQFSDLTQAEFLELLGALDNILGFFQNEPRPAANYLPALYKAKAQ